VAHRSYQRGRGRSQPPLRDIKLTEPEVVPMTEHQYRQAVQLLAAMIVSWLESPEGKPAWISTAPAATSG
jgi:hypothetical protein